MTVRLFSIKSLPKPMTFATTFIHSIWQILKKEYQLGSYHWKLLITFSEFNIRIFFAIWCISSPWLHICTMKLHASSGFLLNTCFWQKCPFLKEKMSHFGEGCVLTTPVSTAGVFSQIFTTHPTAQGLGNNLLYGSVGSYRKSMKYGLPKNLSLITYFRQFSPSTLEVSQWQWLILKHGNSVYHEFKKILKENGPKYR